MIGLTIRLVSVTVVWVTTINLDQQIFCDKRPVAEWIVRPTHVPQVQGLSPLVPSFVARLGFEPRENSRPPPVGTDPARRRPVETEPTDRPVRTVSGTAAEVGAYCRGIL